jgi:hypothetical protein
VYDIQPLDVSISPNPATDRVNVRLDNLSSVLLYDVNGRLLRMQNNIGTNQHAIDVSNLRSGVYILVAINEDRQGTSQKIVKR